jgi:DNA-directed RNA polymerase sigma subunit (sigma70/sigma32)
MTLSALKTYGLAALDPRELYVLVRRFGLDGEPEDKLADIGDTLGLSREAVRQIEAKAIAKIQHPMVLRKIQRHGRS